MSENSAAEPDQHAEEPKNPDVRKAAEAPDAPEATEAPIAAGAPRAAKAPETPEAPAKLRGGRKRLAVLVSLTVITALLLLSGGAAALYVNSVHLPSPIGLPSTTTLYYSDGTVLARLGEINRTEVPYDDLVDGISKVVVAAEDPDFWTGSAGSITRRVVRSAFDIGGDGVNARARVVVAAVKVENMWSKEQILGRYLNDSSFGRLSYGAEAGAQAYFGKTVNKTAPPEQQITVPEAMVLVAMLRQPDPDPNDPQGSPGYDPARGAKATENSRNRWNEIRTSMVALKYLTQEQADAMTYPTTIKPYAGRADRSGMQRPVGLVANHVLSELTTNPSSQFKGMTWSAIRDGGYKIYTTIDPRAQAAVETSADAAVAGSVMAGQPANLQSAAVLVEPGTGRVQGYFGGHDGMGADYAGFYYDEKGGAAGFGAHPPGSSFMVQTLAGGLKAGVSLKSNWLWTPHDMPGRTGTAQIRNASTCPSDQNKTGACSLLDSTVASLNVSFYGLTASVTPAKVLEMARDAGIDSIWTDSRERQDLSQVKDMGQVTPAKFDIIVGLGQYPVTVLDQANAMATYAAGGVRAEAHFVAKVIKDDKVVYGEKLPTSDQRRILSPEAIADLDYALSQTQAGKLTGRDSASKTGSWEYNGRSDQNAHAWMVGYTTSLAMAVWIGGKGEEVAIKDSSGSTIWGSGLPAKIYRDVMNTAHDAMKLTPAAFPPPAFVGTDNPPGAIAS